MYEGTQATNETGAMLPDGDENARRLKTALGASVAEVVLQMVVLTARGALGVAPLRLAFLAAKLPFCWQAGHRRPGAYLVVWLFEFAGFAAAFAVHGALAPRLGFAAIAAGVMVLLGRAVSAYPLVEWKPR